MWRNFRFLHICHVEKFEITPNVEKFQISPHLSCIKIWNFSTWQIFLHMSHLWYLWQISGMAHPLAFGNCFEWCSVFVHLLYFWLFLYFFTLKKMGFWFWSELIEAPFPGLLWLSQVLRAEFYDSVFCYSWRKCPYTNLRMSLWVSVNWPVFQNIWKLM